MKKLDQRGAFDAMLIVLLVVLLAFGGFVVWRVTAADNETADVAVSTQAGSESKASQNSPDESVNEQGEEQATTDSIDSASTWQEYVYEAGGFAISHPEDWSASVEQQGNRVDFKSSDFVRGTQEYVAVDEGVLLEVFVRDSTDDVDTKLSSLAEAQANLGNGDFKEITIDGKRAIYSTLKQHGSYVEAITYVDNKQYIFRYDSTKASGEALESALNEHLETVRFL